MSEELVATLCATTGPAEVDASSLNASSKFNFTLGAALGAGATSCVHAVEKPLEEGRFAAKFFRPDKGKQPAALQREVQILAKLPTSAYIVNFHGYYSTKVEATSVLQRNLRRDSNASTVAVPEEEEHGVFFFILMDRCDCTLYSLIQKTAFSEPEACFATEALLQGVTHLHNLRLVHRDIKDLNIMVADAGRKVCLGDFDLATSIPEKDTLIEWKGGTPGYMAPEVWSKGRGGFKADIFGVGVVLHVLLTRSNPFHPDEVSKPGNSGPLSYDIVRLFRSESSCELLYSLLAEDPELRPSAQEALDFSWLLGEEVVKSNLCKHVVKLGFASEDEGHEQTERPNGSRSLALWRRKGPEAGTKSPGVSGSSFFRTVSRTMRTARSILPFARRHSKIVPVPDLKEVDFDDVCLP
ncbi:unnamed protein product [Durusdinium trenchii]|uniref:Protein kinase domain-containing protein n=1 Tax=Durusdinium trenchii TaxID=1381693 RepID=A0ABP0M0L1_9DINO